MVNLVAFDTSEELSELTGLTRDELWDVGFDLDDWDIGFQSDTKLHSDPTEEEIKNGDFYKDAMIYDPDLPAHWLMWQMSGRGCYPDYLELNGKHYYLVHHG